MHAATQQKTGFGYIGVMFSEPSPVPARLWLLPHPRRERGEPTARPLLCAALACSDEQLPLHRSLQGRPLLGPPYERFDTGWSHSGDALLLALGESIQLGVDLEQVRPRPRARELARRFFHADEVRWLEAGGTDAMEFSFVRLWCAKEAVLKAHGQGLSFGLHKLVFAEQGNAMKLVACDAALGAPADWTLHEWTPQAGYRAALAWRPLTAGAGAV
jgi:4'-phosphopantetheinyl transferase